MPSQPRKKRAETLKPIPQPPRRKLTAKELAERPPPQRKRKDGPAQAAKRRAKIKRRSVPEAEKKRLEAVAAQRKKVSDLAKKIMVHLSTFHRVGGESYGPGAVWVPSGVSLTLLEMDRRAVEVESSLYRSNSNIIVSNGRGAQIRAIPVANPNFDRIWLGENPPIFDQVSGRGMDVGQGPRF